MSTTMSTSLEAAGCSSASPSRLWHLATTPLRCNSSWMLRPRAAFVAAVRLSARPAPWQVVPKERSSDRDTQI